MCPQVQSTGSRDVAIRQNEACPQLPGTVLRISIPAGAVINLLNLIEITSPSGICLIIRLPILGGNNSNGLGSLIQSIKDAGGSIQVVTE